MVFRTCHCPMISRLKLTLVLILLLPGMVRPVLAAKQIRERIPEQDQPILPSLGIHFTFDSDIYGSGENAVESWMAIATPAILFSTAPAPRRYVLLYAGEYGHFFEDSADNYADHILSGAALFQFGSRGQLDVIAMTEKGHRRRGSYQTSGLDPTSPLFPSEPDTFDRHDLEGEFRYGAEGNRGRLRFGIGGTRFESTNNRVRTQFLDYDTLVGSTGLSLLFHQRTAVVLDAWLTDVRYETEPPGGASRDSEDWRFLLGLTWEATAKTEGSIRLGIERRRFDDPARATASNPSWEVDVRWSPREYSRFDFLASRKNEETFAQGDFIDTSLYTVSWTHEWSRSWGSIVRWDQRDRDFVGSSRDQETSIFYVGLRYQQGRLLTWDAGFARRSRDSSFSNLVYDANMFTIGVNIGT